VLRTVGALGAMECGGPVGGNAPSLRARIRELRSHPSVVIWANGSDGMPLDSVLNDYHQILKEEHWQNTVVDTVSHVEPHLERDPHGRALRVAASLITGLAKSTGPARGSSAEEGDNETIPPVESLKKFIPPDKLWPINDTWYFHGRRERGEQHAGQYHARHRQAVWVVAQRGGIFPERRN